MNKLSHDVHYSKTLHTCIWSKRVNYIPVYSCGHKQMKPAVRGWHLPPLRQGSEKQLFTSNVSLKSALIWRVALPEKKPNKVLSRPYFYLLYLDLAQAHKQMYSSFFLDGVMLLHLTKQIVTLNLLGREGSNTTNTACHLVSFVTCCAHQPSARFYDKLRCASIGRHDIYVIVSYNL